MTRPRLGDTPDRFWTGVFALPNLALPDPTEPGAADGGLGSEDLAYRGLILGTAPVAIVHPADPRAVAAAARALGVRQLVVGFRDVDGDPVTPALLLVRDALPSGVTREALVAFRNALALATILRSRTAVAAGNGSLGPRWSDTFDLYPAQVSRDGHLQVDSPAVRDLRALGADEHRPLHAATAPYLHVAQQPLLVDGFLHRALGAAWRVRFQRRRPTRDWAHRALFRSLELAFRAAADFARCRL